MNKSLALFAAAAAVAFSAPVFAAEKETYKSETKIEKDSKGNYEGKTDVEKKDTAGTKTETETKVKVDVDANGETEKTATTKTVTDPKGLFNKQTAKTKDTVKTKHGQVETAHEKTVNGRTVAKTKNTAAGTDADANADLKTSAGSTAQGSTKY